MAGKDYMARLLSDTLPKASRIDIQIAAHEWAEFLYQEYLRERDILRLYKQIGWVAIELKGGNLESNRNMSGIVKKASRE